MILVADYWPTNAHLMTEAVFPTLRAAGLWNDDTSTLLDPTFGRGLWWGDESRRRKKFYRPTHLTYRTRREDPTFDYQSLPWNRDSFDVVAYDPPYAVKGGVETSGIKDMDDRYGMNDVKHPDDLLRMNEDGLVECIRVARKAVLLKSMNFVSGGVLQCHTDALVSLARDLDWVVYEQFTHLNRGRPQPPGRRQLRGRQRPSTLTILVPFKLRRGKPGKCVK